MQRSGRALTSDHSGGDDLLCQIGISTIQVWSVERNIIRRKTTGSTNQVPETKKTSGRLN